MAMVSEAPKPATTFSVEEGTESDKPHHFTELSIQKAFLRKVYGILTCQLVLTLGIIVLLLKVEPVRLWTRENPQFYLGAVLVALFCAVTMVCCDTKLRKTPLNLICLGVFTTTQSVLLGFMSSFMNTDVVVMVASITAVICVALTIYAFQTKDYKVTLDFMVGGSLVISLLIGLLCFGNLAVFYYHTKTAFYVSGGALLISVLLIIETYLIMKEKIHKYSIYPEEYVFAALKLYMNIANPFVGLLRCILCRWD